MARVEPPQAAFPQPHEGITGTRRYQDTLLVLTDEALPVRDTIIVLARHLYTAVHVGHPAPAVEIMGRRMHDPRPGDLIVETTAMWQQRAPHDAVERRAKGCGILLERRREWACTDSEWRAHLIEDPTDDERQTDEAWYVQYGPDAQDVCRWTNCSFVAIPNSLNAKWHDMAR